MTKASMMTFTAVTGTRRSVSRSSWRYGIAEGRREGVWWRRVCIGRTEDAEGETPEEDMMDRMDRAVLRSEATV